MINKSSDKIRKTLRKARNEILIELIKTDCVILESIGNYEKLYLQKQKINELQKEITNL